MDENEKKSLKLNEEIYVEIEDFVIEEKKVETKNKELTKEQRRNNYLKVLDVSKRATEPINIMNKGFRENLRAEVNGKIRRER